MRVRRLQLAGNWWCCINLFLWCTKIVINSCFPGLIFFLYILSRLCNIYRHFHPLTMSKIYHKEKVIGSGTFGNVWLVKSKINNGFFVQKEINLSKMDANETQQALNEVTILSRCRHRNIIKYKDALLDHKKKMLSIIMEYADGGDLYTAIIKQKGVPFKDYNVISWFTQICLALQYIHHMSILHRDLKSRNIFLTRDKQIKIGDFGIARCLMETNELAMTAIGTPYYLSPEICHQKPYNHKSDMWAAGCVLFEMAALHHPFEAVNFAHLLTLIITGKRKPLPRHCCSLIRDLVQKLLDENPETRPSADSILALPALQPYLSEVWKVQNDNSSSVSKILNEKINTRRYSVSDKDFDSNGLPLQRRASISSAETKGTKTRFGFANKGKNAQAPRMIPNSRSHSVKVYKNSPKISAVKKEQYMTYKVLNPVTFKDRIANILSSGLKTTQSVRNSLKRVDYFKSREESDLSSKEKSLNCMQDSFMTASTSIGPKTSTQKGIDVPNFNIEDDDVFDTKTNDAKEENNFQEEKDAHSGCPHSQCQQCMINMLWKNRIRGVIGPMLRTDERLELIKKLQSVFGEDFFDTVYHVLASNWENNENTETPKSLIDVTNSLNFSQLQHLPLVMQLIQLDLVLK